MKTNRVSVLATTAMLSFGLTACGVIGSQADDSPVVIGADLELTGPYAAIGNVYQHALQLEIAQINAAGGADGHPLQLIVRDNHSDPQTATSDIASLTSEEDLAAIVTGACGDCLSAVMKTLNAKKIPTISLAPADLASLGRGTPTTGSDSYLFKINPNASDNAAVLTALLKSDPDTHKYAILTLNDSYGPALASSVRSDAQKAHVQSVATEQVSVSANESSLRQAVHEAVSQSPEALVVSLPPAQATQVVQLARDESYSRQIYFDAIAAGNLFLPSPSERVMEGVTMVAPQSLVIDDTIATSPAQTARRQWFAAYTSKYGSFSAYSLYAADATQVISSAVESAGGTGHDQLRNAIEATQMEGLSGPLRFTPDDHSGLTSQALTNVSVTDDNRWHLANG